MPPKIKTPILISSHAMRRWRERVGNEKARQIQRVIRSAINFSIKKGMNVQNGSSTIPVTKDVSVVVCPSIQGGWEVITVIREEGQAG